MSKPVIAIDIDDVLVVSEPNLTEHYNKHYGTQVTHRHLKAGLADALLELGHSREEVVDRIEDYLISHEFTSLQPIEEAVDAIKKLNAKYELIAVTGRGSYIERETLVWLRRHFPDLFSCIHLVGQNRWGEGFKVQKQPIFLEHNVATVIDDSLNTCRNSAANGMQALLFGNYPWNQAEKLPGGVRRVGNWAGVLEVLL